jgi:eukaryotic-like serine/threonine-protein kinase
MGAGTRELEFLKVLGAGGFGEVYLANLHGRDRFVRRVAVKLLLQEHKSEELLRRHRDEARLLGLLHHDHIVQVLELTEIEGRPAVVMEYVQGVDLAEILEAGEKFTQRAALEVVRAVASALDAAWSSSSPVDGRPLRVIHRDIKPANVLLTASGSVKVLDFGIARGDFDRDGKTKSGMWGTPHFMAPEMWLGGEQSPGLDTYALGVTFLDLLTGGDSDRPPLEEGRYARHWEMKTGQFPEEIRDFCLSMLRYNAEDRPTHRELVEGSNKLLEGAVGESLAMLAARMVPVILAGRVQSQEPLRLRRVTLDSPTLTPQPAEDHRTDSTNGIGWMVGMGGLAVAGSVSLLAVGLVGGMWWWQGQREPVASVVETTDPAPPPDPGKGPGAGGTDAGTTPGTTAPGGTQGAPTVPPPGGSAPSTPGAPPGGTTASASGSPGGSPPTAGAGSTPDKMAAKAGSTGTTTAPGPATPTVVVVPVEPPKEVVPPKEPEPAPKEVAPAAPSTRKVSFVGARGWKVAVPGGPTFPSPGVVNLSPGLYSLSISPPTLPEWKDKVPFTCSVEVYASSAGTTQEIRLNDATTSCR